MTRIVNHTAVITDAHLEKLGEAMELAAIIETLGDSAGPANPPARQAAMLARQIQNIVGALAEAITEPVDVVGCK